ncbi:MAG: DegV family protein [Clostridia bacterium]|nr:DegV family protein [Clostridia bacterium]
MRKFVVLTDSACDLPQELAQKHHIDILCFKIALDGQGYTERVDFTPEQFSDMLRRSEGMPTTSQITQYEFLEKFEEYDRQGLEDVLYVSINATGSGTNANAQAAAAEFKEEHPDSPMRITIVDSHSYSVTYGLECCRAAEMLEEGKTVEEVAAYLDDRFARLELVVTAYTLKVIRRSGRLSAAAAIAGDLLGIRPIITLIDGESKVVKKVRGDKLVMSSVIAHCKNGMVPGTAYYIGVTNEKYAPEYEKAAEEAIGYPPAGVFHLGSAVCSNTGPECAAMLYEGPKRER